MFHKRLLLQALPLAIASMRSGGAWAQAITAEEGTADAPSDPPGNTPPGSDFWSNDLGQGAAQRGMASWYGKRFHGRRTASGEIFRANALTAAHRTLPLFSYAKVTLLKNGKSVVVRINDRGPHILTHRVIDLSQAAAAEIGLLALGTGEVLVERVLQRTPEDSPGIGLRLPG
jgi:rare lipoprotein A